MVTKHIDHLNLRKIMNSGQIFRMYEPEAGHFIVYSGDRRLELYQYMDGENDKDCGCTCKNYGENPAESRGGVVKTVFGCTPKEFGDYWEDYFDLKRDYEAIVEKAREYEGTEFLKSACEYGADIRVLKQDIWEMMISFIISQQKQIPSIRKCIEGLCQRFGRKHIVHGEEETWYGFPTAEEIASAGPEGLKGLSLGYRERYIYETSVKYLTEGIPDEQISCMSYEEAKRYFCSYTGIGEKVADCICLFGAGFTDAFPIDVHVKDILYREFLPEDEKQGIEGDLKNRMKTSDIPRKKLLESLTYADYMKLIDDNFSQFKGARGIVQQWIFAYEIKT